jgi:hypothetical protein
LPVAYLGAPTRTIKVVVSKGADAIATTARDWWARPSARIGGSSKVGYKRVEGRPSSPAANATALNGLDLRARDPATRTTAITDEVRNRLYNTLREKLGAENATTMMELIPPVGWADVATTSDLDHLVILTKRDIDDLGMTTKRDIDNLGAELRAEWRREMLQQTFALLAATPRWRPSPSPPRS